jgi:predicted ATPase/DNA-binding winged helix-turn-helix (wHTH) protein
MANRPVIQDDASFAFGSFSLLPGQRILLEDGEKVALGSRALDVLIALVDRAGQVVSNRDLTSRVWPSTVVGEGSLKVAVAELRKALGDDRDARRFVVNVPGRGYMFVAPVVRESAATESDFFVPSTPASLPSLPTRLIGRDAVVPELVASLQAHRLVSIVGPGGIGKTMVAVAVAERFAETFDGEVCFVDLGTISAPGFVAAAIARALGVVIRSEEASAELAAALHGRNALVVLDCCERVLDAAGALVENLLGASAGIRVLATSREPLRVVGELVHRLAPLTFPDARQSLSAQQAMSYSAVRLFVERASASSQRFKFDDAEVPLVVAVCAKLDGVPLSIELAATRVDAYPLRELLALLQDRLRLLQLNRRGAQPRHASLMDTLDWSYSLLAPDEQVLLRKLSVFPGGFTSSGAVVVGDDVDAVGLLGGLVAKSLVSVVDGGPARYRLMDTTRAYAGQQLDAHQEEQQARRLHAQFQLRELIQAGENPDAQQGPASFGESGLDDVRCAIDWAASRDGDPELRLALRIAAIPLWLHLSLLTECRDNLQRELDADRVGRALAPTEAMKLKAALGVVVLHTRGPRGGAESLWTDALRLAELTGDPGYRLRMLWALPLHLNFAGDYRRALVHLRRFRAVARTHGDRVDQLSCDRLCATTLYYLGHLASARRRTERMLRDYESLARPSHIDRYQYEPLSMARGTLANLLWLLGCPDHAMVMAGRAVNDARQADHPLSLFTVLGQAAIPLSLHAGDHAAAERYLSELLEMVPKSVSVIGSMLVSCVHGVVMAARGDPAEVARLEQSLSNVNAAGYRLHRSWYLCELSKGQAMCGRTSDALATVRDAIQWCGQSGERWYLAEALRIEGDLLAMSGDEGSLRKASACIEESMRIARRQGALSWELRAAMSRVRLTGDASETTARAELSTTLGCFTDGFQTADLRQAADLLAAR